MADGMTDAWFLEMDGKKTGPFTIEQVLGLLAEEEIPETQLVTSATLGTEWITVREMAQRFGSTAAPAAPRGRSFNPPPRPDLTGSIVMPGADNPFADPPVKSPSDPALSLFDALQAAKDAKESARERTRQIEMPMTPPSEGIPNKVWMLAGVGLVILGSVWALSYFIKDHMSKVPDPVAPHQARSVPPNPVTPPPAAAVVPPPPVAQPVTPPPPPPVTTRAFPARPAMPQRPVTPPPPAQIERPPAPPADTHFYEPPPGEAGGPAYDPESGSLPGNPPGARIPGPPGQPPGAVPNVFPRDSALPRDPALMDDDYQPGENVQPPPSPLE